MCNTIRNRISSNSLELKTAKPLIKNIVTTEENKVDLIIKEEITNDIAEFDFKKSTGPDFLFKSLNFDDKKNIKKFK